MVKGKSNKNGKQVSNDLVTRAQVRSMLRENDLATRELKVYGSTSSGYATTTPTVTLMSGIAQGDNTSDRDGFQINLKDVEVHLTVSIDTVSQDYFRFVVLYDTENTGSAPVSADIMNASDPRAFIGTYPIIAKRFHVVKDYMIPLVLATTKQNASRFFKVNFKNLPLTFSGTGSTAVGRNAFYFWLCGGNATNNTAYNVYFRFRYFDS